MPAYLQPVTRVRTIPQASPKLSFAHPLTHGALRRFLRRPARAYTPKILKAKREKVQTPPIPGDRSHPSRGKRTEPGLESAPSLDSSAARTGTVRKHLQVAGDDGTQLSDAASGRHGIPAPSPLRLCARALQTANPAAASASREQL